MRQCNKEVNQFMVNSVILIFMTGVILYFEKTENYILFVSIVIATIFFLIRCLILGRDYFNCIKK
ncbi:MAG: hypothetical protein COB42_08765 [Sulfurimonas sp.]|nr:MAG: hypothetical protein COB42_08765 [Sulfurimonas sp.]